MIKYTIRDSSTKITGADYLFEDSDKFYKLLPYLKRKIDGEWNIAIFEPPIKDARTYVGNQSIPEYVTVTLYLTREVMGQLYLEHPNIAVQEKTAYEKYLDLIAELKVNIEPKAAKELYRRVGRNKDKIAEYLMTLSENGDITLCDVKEHVIDERSIYASTIIEAFLFKDRWRWNKYDKYVAMLGREYAFYALRKYTRKLLVEKNAYLHNEETKTYWIGKVDGFRICHAYIVFHTANSAELDTCMRMLDDRELYRRIYDSDK